MHAIAEKPSTDTIRARFNYVVPTGRPAIRYIDWPEMEHKAIPPQYGHYEMIVRNGRPEEDYQVLATWSYSTAFNNNNYGLGSAIAVVTVLLLLGVMAALPHRYPMLLVDRVEELDRRLDVVDLEVDDRRMPLELRLDGAAANALAVADGRAVPPDDPGGRVGRGHRTGPVPAPQHGRCATRPPRPCPLARPLSRVESGRPGRLNPSGRARVTLCHAGSPQPP